MTTLPFFLTGNAHSLSGEHNAQSSSASHPILLRVISYAARSRLAVSEMRAFSISYQASSQRVVIYKYERGLAHTKEALAAHQ